MATKPIGDLVDPVMADAVRRRRVAACMRAMDTPTSRREPGRSRGLTQGRIAVRLKRSRENVSRLEREDDPGLSNGESP